ncbi:MAG: hypothetical protein Q4E09_06625 [Eubacteriales bacterium]|nr:hypothetical protein [Eubacteriales bacterium]
MTMQDMQDKRRRSGPAPQGKNYPRSGAPDPRRTPYGARPNQPGTRPVTRPANNRPGAGHRPVYSSDNRPAPRPGTQRAGFPDYRQSQPQMRQPAPFSPEAEAAQRAARRAMEQDPDYFANHYDYQGDDYGLDDAYDDNRNYVDELLDAEEVSREGLPGPLKLAIGLAAAILAIVLAFFIIRSLVSKDKSDVRLEKQSSTKIDTIVTTTEAPTTERTTVETTPKVTLPPVGTDPYQNPPAWVPPSAPPPQVDVLITEPEETLPQENLPEWEEQPEAPVEEPQPEAPPVSNPPAVVEVPITPPAEPTNLYAPTAPLGPDETPMYAPTAEPTAAQPAYGNTDSEYVALELLPPRNPAEAPIPEPQPGKILESPGGLSLLQMDANGQYVLNSQPGDYSAIYSSYDHSQIVAQTADGRFYQIEAGREPVELPSISSQGLEHLVGNRGCAYISDGQLYYLTFADQSLTMLAANVTDAVIAGQAQSFLMVADSGVKIMDVFGNYRELLPPFSSNGVPKLDYFSQDGEIAIFQDDFSVYVYNPRLFAEDVVRISKPLEGYSSQVRTLSGSNEVLLVQEGSNSLIRISPVGGLEKVSNPGWQLSANSVILGAGSSSEGIYSNLVLINQGKLYLSNDSMVEGDSNYGALLLDDGVQEVAVGGNAIYWINDQGSLLSVYSSADLRAAEITAQEVSSPGASQITASNDGSKIFFIKDGALWQRESLGTASQLATNVSYYLTNADGSKIYLVTQDGALQAWAGGMLSTLADAGSISDPEASLAINPMSSQGGNTYIASPRINWLANGNIYSE